MYTILEAKSAYAGCRNIVGGGGGGGEEMEKKGRAGKKL